MLLFQPVDIPDEGGQAAETVLLEAAGVIMKQAEIGHPLRAVPTGAGHGQHPAFLIQPVDQPVGRQGGCQGSITLHIRQKNRAFVLQAGKGRLPPFAHSAQSGI